MRLNQNAQALMKKKTKGQLSQVLNLHLQKRTEKMKYLMRARFDVPSTQKITKKCAKYLKSIFVYIELMSSSQFEV